MSRKSKERIICECGMEVCRGAYLQHCKSKHHQKFINNQYLLYNNIFEYYYISMYRFHKHNKKQGTKAHILGETKSNFTPFDLRDTAYLEHLSKELKLRNARAGLLNLRNDMIQANKRANFQNVIESLMNCQDQTYHIIPKNI